MELFQVLQACVADEASDIILKSQSYPKYRKNGDVIALSSHGKVYDDVMLSWVKKILPKHLKSRLETAGDVDFSYTDRAGQRYRVSLFRQRQDFAMVMRVINNHIKTMEELKLPKIIEKFAYLRRGLVLVTGATGSGKTTTLASLLQKINLERASHIITIEDPIEYWFKDAMSTIEQREVGIDTQSFGRALRSALRQNPDVILVGELRDQETTETALMAAETGHLVFATLHTKDAVESLTRLMSYFPAEKAQTVRLTLSEVLGAIISQRLIPRQENGGMCVAVEVMVANTFIRNTIIKGEGFDEINNAIKSGGKNYGMQTFDQSIYGLYKTKLISKQIALEYASNLDDMRLKISGIAS